MDSPACLFLAVDVTCRVSLKTTGKPHALITPILRVMFGGRPICEKTALRTNMERFYAMVPELRNRFGLEIPPQLFSLRGDVLFEFVHGELRVSFQFLFDFTFVSLCVFCFK